ncbi:MAG TPA: ribonuclease E/G, partial [Alphaproteobacteria bacterium]
MLTKKMLIDATQAEETRVAIIEGNRLQAFDFDSASRKQLKGNLYLAKVTRVEPSLQACFVEYGGNRQGFLAFSEIHPDYYRIPVEDREALLAEEAAWGHDDEHDDDFTDAPPASRKGAAQPTKLDDAYEQHMASDIHFDTVMDSDENHNISPSDLQMLAQAGPEKVSLSAQPHDGEHDAEEGVIGADIQQLEKDQTIETVGGEDEDSYEEQEQTARRHSKLRRRYKIQEVIKRRQILLIQVTKEERGNKGAALTTYISLPGRYSVLMPNSPRGGGISRKIANGQDRRRMRELLDELEVPAGMSIILRTAGMQRSKQEVKRDLDYLLRLWDDIRGTTMESVAPALIYEEADIFKRAVRDLYNPDTEEIAVAGPREAFLQVRDFMKLLIPSHARRVKHYTDPLVPLFQRYQVESQIDHIYSPRVDLKSGGYIIINPTEALVSIDVNSGRSTRERNIDDTALNTNLEAAEEIARQLRLRDLGGLVVIDFIDMESGRHNAKVDR